VNEGIKCNAIMNKGKRGYRLFKRTDYGVGIGKGDDEKAQPGRYMRAEARVMSTPALLNQRDPGAIRIDVDPAPTIKDGIGLIKNDSPCPASVKQGQAGRELGTVPGDPGATRYSRLTGYRNKCGQPGLPHSFGGTPVIPPRSASVGAKVIRTGKAFHGAGASCPGMAVVMKTIMCQEPRMIGLSRRGKLESQAGRGFAPSIYLNNGVPLSAVWVVTKFYFLPFIQGIFIHFKDTWTKDF